MRYMWMILLALLGACAKSAAPSSSSSTTGSGSDTTATTAFSYTSNNATSAYNSFNTWLYNPSIKLYYRASDKSGIGAIWTQAIYWDMAMNAYKRTSDAKYLSLVEGIYTGGAAQYANYDWTNQNKWFIWDDIMWWIISLSRAYLLTGEQKFLDNATAGFHLEWYGDPALGRVGSYDSTTGGMEWAWTQRGKTACINYPTVIGALTLYDCTHDTSYVSRARTVYGWARRNLFDASTGRVADNKVDNNP